VPVSNYALSVIDRLRGDGCNLSPRDIIALNERGLAVQKAQKLTSYVDPIYAADSVCVAGLWFHELTVCAASWFYGQALPWWDGTDRELDAMAFAMYHARRPDVFAGLTVERAARRAVSAWCLSVPLTAGELRGVRARLLASDDNAPAPQDDYDGDLYEDLRAELCAATGLPRSAWDCETVKYCCGVLSRFRRHAASTMGEDWAKIRKTAYVRASCEMTKLCVEIRNRGNE